MTEVTDSRRHNLLARVQMRVVVRCAGNIEKTGVEGHGRGEGGR